MELAIFESDGVVAPNVDVDLGDGVAAEMCFGGSDHCGLGHRDLVECRGEHKRVVSGHGGGEQREVKEKFAE